MCIRDSYGTGEQTRSFCYVDDLVDGLIRLMAYEGDYAGAVNLGNPAEITVRELVARVLHLTSSQSRIVARPLPVDDPQRRRPDISLAQRLLGWKPRTDLERGLERTIAYFAEEAATAASFPRSRERPEKAKRANAASAVLAQVKDPAVP